VSDFAGINPTGTVTFTDTTASPNATLGSGLISAGVLGLNFVNSSEPAISGSELDFGTQVAVGDFNGDGIPDIAVCEWSDGVGILLGNGDGTFQPEQLLTAVCYGGIAVGDFNRDGKLDIAAMSYPAGNVTILLGNGDGTFSSGGTYSTGVNAAYPVAGDFNGDGKLDLVIGNNQSNSEVEILLGNGDGSFQSPVGVYGSSSGPLIPAIGDFNGDGKLDLAISEYRGSDVEILLGNGDGTFGSPIAYATGVDSAQAVAADLNHDGKLDLAVANYSGQTISVLLGNGDGTFASQTIYNTSSNPFSIAVADFGLSGYPDLVT
jgi:hypothetical protein